MGLLFDVHLGDNAGLNDATKSLTKAVETVFGDGGTVKKDRIWWRKDGERCQNESQSGFELASRELMARWPTRLLGAESTCHVLLFGDANPINKSKVPKIRT